MNKLIIWDFDGVIADTESLLLQSRIDILSEKFKIKYLIPIIKYGFYDVYLHLLICTLIPVILISLYNGKKGKDIKYLLYLFYPIHLLLIYGIYLINQQLQY